MRKAVVIGVGTPPEKRGSRHFGQGYAHAGGYRRTSGVRLVGAADLDVDHLEAFGETYDLPASSSYRSHTEMLAAQTPDVVSVCTPPGTHASIIRDCLEAGVEAIHAEKPLAPTWGTCRAIAGECADAGVTLTVNHQRRFARPVTAARSLIEEGAIGRITHLGFRGKNLFDYGIHLFDVCDFLLGDVGIEWAEAMLEYEVENKWYGCHNENRAVALFGYSEGIEAIALTGEPAGMAPRIVVAGTEGRLEFEAPDGPSLRVKTDEGTRSISTRGDVLDKLDPFSTRGRLRRVIETVPGTWFDGWAPRTYTERGISDLIEALENGRPPRLAADHSLRAIEAVFACYESVRRDERVYVPLDIEDNPLEAMVENGTLSPRSD